MFTDSKNLKDCIQIIRPKTKKELRSIIKERIKKEGNNCDLNDIDTSLITDMSDLFMTMIDFNGDISNWNVSNVTNMNSMFCCAHSFNQDISSWNVSKATDMYSMFFGAHSFNQDISSWNVSNATNMCRMFDGAELFNQDISSWDVSKVTNMDYMFAGAESFNQDISKWNVSDAADMVYMFYACPIKDEYKPDFNICGPKEKKIKNHKPHIMFTDSKNLKDCVQIIRPATKDELKLIIVERIKKKVIIAI